MSLESVKLARTKEFKAKLVAEFASLSFHAPDKNPGSVFMAGSPGAGKTEFSINLIKKLKDGVVRIDPDEVRKLLPQYKGGNASLFQNAVNIGVDHLYYFALKNDQNFILDGTLANLDKARSNISRCLEHRDIVEIYYLFQDPSIAWKFTQNREIEEGRHIDKETFIRAFLSSKANVEILKNKFGGSVRLNLVIKDYKNDIAKTKIDIENIDNHIQKFYNENELKNLL